jgi:zinc protease
MKSLLNRIRLRTFSVLSVIVVSAVFFSCTIPAGPPAGSGIAPVQSVWPDDESDLVADRQVLFGRLDNGLRYIIRENQTPADRVSMHLYVQVGSLFERDEERGASHFLEHMLFNGSKNFPPGEMVKYFQRIGMQFGPDANAHTGFNKTVYDVLLPKGDRNSLAEGLLVLRDYADGALLLPEEVERERNVILAEMRSRDSASFRTLKETFRFEMPGLIVAQRFPIGVEGTVRQMDDRLLRDYYEAWYRPERMFVVVVGDCKKETVKQLIAERFGDVKSSKPPRTPPDFGRMAHNGVNGYYHYEKDAGATTVAIETVVQKPEPKDSLAYRKERMIVELVHIIMKKRLDDMVRRQKTVLTSAGISGGYYLDQIKYTEISGRTSPENWSSAVTELEQALRTAILYGFTPAEFERAKNEYAAGLIKAQKQEKTRDSKAMARDIMACIRDWEVLLSPTQKAELLLPEVQQATLEQANQVFADIWSAGHRLVFVTGNSRLPSSPVSPGRLIASTYSAGSKIDVQPFTEKQIAKFPYLPTPQYSGEIVQRTDIKDLGITKVLFGNGVTLFMKPTTFKKDQILATLSFGGGKASEPLDQPGLAVLTEAVVNESGFGAMDRIDLESVLAGRLASIKLQIREDLFMIKGQATQKELPLLFQLMHAGINDPGYREDARRLALKRFEQEHRSLSKSVDGIMKCEGVKFLAGGDSRFGMPVPEQVHKRTLNEIRTWITPQIQQTPLELAVVGDFEIDQVIELASQYLGSLPSRDPGDSVTPVAGPKFPQGGVLSLNVQTQTPKALVVVAYPTADFWDIKRTRRLSIMAELYSERLRQQIREKLGAAYSPFAYNRSFRAYKGYGVIQIHVQVDPDQVQTIVDEVQHISAHLRSSSTDADEFRRVLDPTLTYIKDLRQKNEYWLNSVLTGAARHPEQLDWARSFVSDFAAIEVEEISNLARQYLVDDCAATIVLSPDKDTSQK